MLGTPQVLGSNLTRACFFFQTRNIPFQIKFSANFFSASLSVVGLVVTSRNCFFFCAIFYAVFSVWFTPINGSFTYFDFVFPSLFFLFR